VPITQVKPIQAQDGAGSDQRRQRRSRNLERVVSALIELWTEGQLRPGAAEVAERAGLSERSLFRYFEDMPALQAEALAQHAAREAELGLFDMPEPRGNLAARVEALVDLRLWQHKRLAPMARITFLHAPFNPQCRDSIALRRTYLREQLQHMFASELERLPADERRVRCAAAEIAVGYEALETLLVERRFSRRDTRAVLVASLGSLLSAPHPKSRRRSAR